MTNRTWNLKNPTNHDFTPEELARIDPNLYPYLFDERVYTSDEFRMFGFKVKRCPRIRSHDWTSCPFAHRAEKARRRDPRRYSYAASVCPDFRNNHCHRGDACHFAHGVFEYWLHPTMYRTRACNSGRTCRRKVCFFAHSPQELRDDAKYHCFLAHSPDGGVPSLPKHKAVPSAAALPFVPRVRAAAGGSGGGRGQSSPGGGSGGGRDRRSAGDSDGGGGGGSPDFLASLSGLTIREGDGNGNGRGIFPWGVWGPAPAAAGEEEEEGQDIEWITDMME